MIDADPNSFVNVGEAGAGRAHAGLCHVSSFMCSLFIVCLKIKLSRPTVFCRIVQSIHRFSGGSKGGHGAMAPQPMDEKLKLSCRAHMLVLQLPPLITIKQLINIAV